MKRERRGWKLVVLAAAMALMPVAVTWGQDAAGPTAADYQNLQEKYQQVQRQLSEVSKDVAAIKDTQAALKKQEAEIKKQQRELKRKQAKLKAAQAEAAATSQQATDQAVKHLYNQVVANSQKEAGTTEGGGGGNNINATIENLFAPPTGEHYFSPFSKQNPDHMRPDQHMQIAQWGNMKLYLGFWTVGRFQGLQQYNLGKPTGMNPNFQTPYGMMDLYATVPHEFDMFADFYIASPEHPSQTYGDEGWLVFKQLPGFSRNSPINQLMDYINVKAGAFDIDFGDNNYHRSKDAWVQNNPLIGNPLVDPSTEEIGGEVYSVKGPVYWLFGVSNGSTTGHFDYGAGPSFHGKLWGYPTKDLRLSGSVYYGDMGESADTIDLFTAARSGEAYANLFGNSVDTQGQIVPQAGHNVFAAQGDITYEKWPFESYSYVGWTQDNHANRTGIGTPRESWLYGSSNLVYHITPSLYLAAQYSYAFAGAVNGVDTNGWVDRIQVGAGYWLTRSLLAKVEYVQEQFRSFGSNTGLVNSAQANLGPGFNGVVMEVSFGF
jgi:Skp family chaperone for outer membrane proteins